LTFLLLLEALLAEVLLTAATAVVVLVDCCFIHLPP
jgi:hypothetical protein